MKNVLTKRLAVFCSASAAFVLALPATIAKPSRVACAQRKQSDAPVKSQVDLKVNLENELSVVAGEPVTLHYVITNTAQNEEEEIAADFGEDYGKLYTLKLVREDGTVLPLLPEPSRPRSTGGWGSSPSGFLGSGQSREGFVVITQRFALARKGKYTLTFDANIPYTRYNPNGPNQMVDFGNLRATGLATQGKYTYPITVREAAPGDLISVANQLRRRFFASNDAKQKERLATALFSMSPSEVLPLWKRVAYEASASDRPILAKALAHTGKKEAADILVKMEFYHPVQDSAGNAVSVMRNISDMSLAGSADLQKHIQSLLAAQRAKLPSYPIAID